MNQEDSIEFAKKYLEDLLSFFGVNVEVEANVSEDGIELAIPSNTSNSLLIGRGAETLRAIQYLVSTTLRNKGSELRVNVDIADYKKQRNEKLIEQAREWIESVRSTGNSYIAHLNAADRRIVHHVASEYEDIETFSEGEDRDRHLIIAQKSS